ncbi:MAG TPA: hypothetical protein VH583_03670 [Vicinamibacterales bacterium]
MTVSYVAVMLAFFLGAASEKPVAAVQAPDSPVRLEHATVLTSGDGGPPVLLYSATNTTGDALDQFTVIAFVFNADGTLKARQTAPGRHLLDAHETKYSTLVLDGSAIDPTDQIVVGVNQAQRVNSDAWWRADIQPAAEAAAHRKKP